VLTPPFEGGCQCGAVRYRCTAAPFVAYTCHCLDCQHITASAFATCIHVPTEALTVPRGSPREVVRTADSGNLLTTSFCTTCGSALIVANSSRSRTRTILVGTLDDASDAEVTAHIFTSRKLPWVVLPEGHRIFPEAGDWRRDYASDPSRLDP
jgi:hypothetical protein